MDGTAAHLLLLTLVVGGGCYPRTDPRSFNSTMQHRSVVKFPHNSSSTTIRSPAGGWIRDVKNKENYKNFTRGESEGSFVFPREPSSDEIGRRPVSPIHACPNNSKFCEAANDYPASYLDSILQNSANEYSALFGNDLVEDDTLTHRIDLPNENPLCDSHVHIAYPMKAEDKDGQLKYVVNMGDYKQGVRVETCVSEGSECAYADAFPMGYKTSCKQKHIYRKLVALNDGKVEPVDFPLPSCCMCVVETMSLRFGLLGQSPAPKTTPKTTSPQTPK